VSATASAHERDRFTRTNRELQIVEHDVRTVAEADAEE